MTTTRTHGPCTCGADERTSDGRLKYPVTAAQGHSSDCPALSHGSQEPDALTRLARHLRQHQLDWTPPTDAWTEQALSLISEVREEQRRVLERAAQAAGDTAAEWDDKNSGIDTKTGPRIAAVCKAIRSLKP